MIHQRITTIFFSMCLFCCNGNAQTVEKLIASGDAARGQLDMKAALRLYREAEQISVSNAEVFLRLSEVFLDLTESDILNGSDPHYIKPAMDYAQRCAKLNANCATASAVLARCLLIQAKSASFSNRWELYRRSKAYAEKAVRADPDNSHAKIILAMWHREITEKPLAERIAARVWHGWYPDGKLELAEKLLTEALSKNPQSIQARLELSKVLLSLHEKQEALSHLLQIESLPLQCIADVGRKAEARKLRIRN
jgi:tetratricopeptide (TPR) repeat protein